MNPNSVREAIVRVILQRLQAALAPVVVLRQPTVAQPRQDSPFVAVVLEADTLDAVVNTAVQRHLLLRITAVSRDAADPWGQADALVCAAHAALLADPTLGALALATEPQDADFSAEDADAAAVAVPAVYRITYRHARGDLTQGA